MSMERENITKCQHATTEWLGSNNAMTFFRCLTCRSVIVTQGGTTSQRNCERLGFRVAYSKVTVLKKLEGN